tara:strand:- start:1133 stop:2029 length:897 start_codon:yes stop_codon:yes gene_type:complete
MPEAVKEKPEENDEVEVEVLDSDDNNEVVEEVTTEEPVQDTKREASEDELENYSESVKKRISKLTAKMREAERREQAALQFAQSAKKELDENKQRAQSLDSSFVQEFENRVKYQDEVYKQQLKDAIDRGDIDAQVQAQKNLAEVASHTERLNVVKQQQARQAQQVEQAKQAPQPQTPPQAVSDPKAQAWASRNEWFGSDEPMTLTAFSIHKTLVESEGYDPHSDDYYAEIDRRIKDEFPHKFNNTPRSSGPVVASANRGGQRKGKQKVQLTKSEVAIADKLGVSYEQYARQKARMQNT